MQPAVLSIAGFDPSSGAGLSADLKVFAAFELYGLACPTALTVQSTQGVQRSEAVDATLLRDMLDCLAMDIPIAGVKIGMLANSAVVLAVAQWLAHYREQSPTGLPVVLDPVLCSSSGALLLEPDAVGLLRDKLLPLVTVLTPNFREAVELAGFPTHDTNANTNVDADIDANTSMIRDAVPRTAKHLLGLMGSAQSAVVITGGDLRQQETPNDFLLKAGLEASMEDRLEEGLWMRGSWVETRATHGTGCAFSSALLCGLVQGLAVEAAARQAKIYVQHALAAAYPIGKGRGPMHHLFARTARK